MKTAFTLTHRETLPVKCLDLKRHPSGFKEEDHFTYTSDDGLTIRFHMHPRWEFVYVRLAETSEAISDAAFRAFVGAWTVAAMNALDARDENTSAETAMAAGIARLRVKV